MKRTVIPILFALALFACQAPEDNSLTSIQVSIPKATEPLDGRLLILFSKNADTEPRFQIGDGPNSQQVFGIDIENWQPGESIDIDPSELQGYPVENFSDLPSNTYNVQFLFNRYETFNLSNGKSVKLPPEMGEGQQWNRKPGNFHTVPEKISVSPLKEGLIEASLNKVIPPAEEPEDTEWIKHIKMKSEKLSKFWGKDVFLGAHVLLPKGFDDHPEAKYPLMIFHGHFPSNFGGFRTQPPDPNLEPDYSARFDVEGYNKIQQEEAYRFYKMWNSDTFPRFIIIEIQHANPYYDDSYAVNSESIGPYGDAITYELIPFIEEKFRGIGEGWSRFLYGGSTGGWEALAAQVFYPDEYNGCFAACPDPIDFRAYTLLNIYEDDNAYYLKSEFKEKVERAGRRDYLGHVSSSIRSQNMKELALGTKTRSGQQWDVWEAVYSPMGEDGYPKRLWDRKTGVIDKEVAEYWKENYDLRHILERDWETLGPKLEGKIRIYCGDMDNYYLNNAVYLMEDFLENTNNPYYNGEIDYGDRAEHCWNGDQDNPNHISRLRYNTMYVPKIMDRIKKSAPKGADLTSWRYK